MRAHWSSVSSWNRDTIPGFQNPTGKFIRHALVPTSRQFDTVSLEFQPEDQFKARWGTSPGQTVKTAGLSTRLV
jgi:hypothetical protein